MSHRLTSYGIALAAVALAALIRALIGVLVAGVAPFATFFPAILVTTLAGGLGPGLLAIGLSSLLAWRFWLEPAAPGVALAVNLGLFVLAGLALVATVEWARRSRARSRAEEQRFRAAEALVDDAFAMLAAERAADGGITDFRWLYASPVMLQRLGRRQDQVAGRSLQALMPGHGSRPELLACYRAVAATGVPQEIELFYDGDGFRDWLRVTVVRLDGGIALSFRPITSGASARRRWPRARSASACLPRRSTTCSGSPTSTSRRWSM